MGSLNSRNSFVGCSALRFYRLDTNENDDVQSCSENNTGHDGTNKGRRCRSRRVRADTNTVTRESCTEVRAPGQRLPDRAELSKRVSALATAESNGFSRYCNSSSMCHISRWDMSIHISRSRLV